ncbi:hypothetical protein IE4771_PB00003 (plasmid) [Rhizobium etli bv. mimosae str. IE4771]|uniref:Uncharacterized protein n=1 Tax=Rhizobium etli bv. mimosae str. IE4771 TaxID=1432050 RepID=A0A060I3L7_RHIET|nr:hypothetical protein IE4771_PB00003 [Rhizobium sp. IE4771]
MAFDELPNMVPVWHGLEREDGKTLGLPWTTDKGVASSAGVHRSRACAQGAY